MFSLKYTALKSQHRNGRLSALYACDTICLSSHLSLPSLWCHSISNLLSPFPSFYFICFLEHKKKAQERRREKVTTIQLSTKEGWPTNFLTSLVCLIFGLLFTINQKKAGKATIKLIKEVGSSNKFYCLSLSFYPAFYIFSTNTYLTLQSCKNIDQKVRGKFVYTL